MIDKIKQLNLTMVKYDVWMIVLLIAGAISSGYLAQLATIYQSSVGYFTMIGIEIVFVALAISSVYQQLSFRKYDLIKQQGKA